MTSGSLKENLPNLFKKNHLKKNYNSKSLLIDALDLMINSNIF